MPLYANIFTTPVPEDTKVLGIMEAHGRTGSSALAALSKEAEQHSNYIYAVEVIVTNDEFDTAATAFGTAVKIEPKKPAKLPSR